MCLALDPEGGEDWLGQEDEGDLAGELYVEEDMYLVIAEATEVYLNWLLTCLESNWCNYKTS